MSALRQLDGTCSADCCNSDGASDEPCEHCNVAVKTAPPKEMAAVPIVELPAEPAPKNPEDVPGQPAPKRLKTTPKKTNYFGTSEEHKADAEKK